MRSFMRFLCVIAGLLIGSGCVTTKKAGDTAAFYAMAILRPTAGSKVSGRVFFTEAFGAVKIHVEAQGLDANSQHAIHIREHGDCTAPDASSAGDHFNPQQVAHGGPDAEVHHAGDLGNVKTDKRGIANTTIKVRKLSINSGLSPVIGRSVVIMKNVDDLQSQPNGGDSVRLACGVIGTAAAPQ